MSYLFVNYYCCDINLKFYILRVRKGYKCHCGKSYKTAQGLKSHALLAHNSSPAEVAAAVSNATVTTTGTTILGRSASPSQSAGSLSPSSMSNMSGSSSSSNLNNLNQSQSQSSQSTTTHTSLNSTLSTSSNLMRNNIGLISIKTNKSNLIAANVTANKILKLTTSTIQSDSIAAASVQQQHENNNKLKFETSTAATTTTKMSLPGLVNLGILTSSSTSQKIQQQQQHTFQQQNVLNNSSSNHENLPLTPISPNMITNSATSSTVAMQSAAAVATVGFHSNGNNDVLATDET